MKAFLAWLEKTSAECVQQSHLGKAVSYYRKHWKELNNFLLDGRLELSNNRAERSIKPFVIGRKNSPISTYYNHFIHIWCDYAIPVFELSTIS